MKKFKKVFLVLTLGLLVFFFLKSIHTMDAVQAQKDLPTLSAANDKQSSSFESNYTNISKKVVATKYITVEGYAGNQNESGISIPSGGYFFWTPLAGPSKTVKFSDKEFKDFNFRTSLGKIPDDDSSEELFVQVPIPSSKKFYKLYVKKYYKIEKIALFGSSTQISQSKKTYIQSMYVTSFIKADAIAKSSK